MAFMLIYYRGAGINADLALFLNLVILLGFMGFVGGTLTLPGIAGVILTLLIIIMLCVGLFFLLIRV